MRTNIEYAVVGNQSLKLDASIPDGNGPFTTVILVHGGGWTHGSKEVYIAPLFKPLTDAGFTWFSIDHRLAPTNRYPAAVDDLGSAIRWVKAHASEFKVNLKKIVLVGESAGGQLVALVGARDGARLGIAGVAPYYAPCDLTAMMNDRTVNVTAAKAISEFLGITTLDDTARILLREASPVTYVNANMPPFLLIHGDADILVPYTQSVVMRDLMKAFGAQAELYTVEGGGHGMNSWERDPKLRAHKAVLVQWIKRLSEVSDAKNNRR